MCNCVARVNVELKNHDDKRAKNTKVKQDLQMDFDAGQMKETPPQVVTAKVRDSGPKPMPLFVTYCPFCGEKWDEE